MLCHQSAVRLHLPNATIIINLLESSFTSLATGAKMKWRQLTYKGKNSCFKQADALTKHNRPAIVKPDCNPGQQHTQKKSSSARQKVKKAAEGRYTISNKCLVVCMSTDRRPRCKNSSDAWPKPQLEKEETQESPTKSGLLSKKKYIHNAYWPRMSAIFISSQLTVAKTLSENFITLFLNKWSHILSDISSILQPWLEFRSSIQLAHHTEGGFGL